MEYKLSEQELKDLMHRTWLKAKKFYTGKTDEYFFDYFESEKKQLPIYGVSSTLDLEKLDKKFDELLKEWDAEKIQEWLDSKG